MKKEMYLEELIRIRRELHQKPELSLKEYETSAYIRNYLENLGYEVISVAGTGLMTTLMVNEKFPLLVLRAELDALPMEEKNEVPYRSENPGVMHACGHDANMATLLVLAKMVMEEKETLNKNIRFLFEPGEEVGQGAELMLAAGALENPKADAFVMFHYGTDQPCGMELHKREASATVGSLQITVKGKSSHWCEHEKGIDALYGAARVVECVHDINEKVRLKHPFVVALGMLHGGKAGNIVAAEAVLNGSIRTYTLAEYEELGELLQRKLREIEQETGTKIEAEISPEPILPMVNDDDLFDIGRAAGQEIYGERFSSSDVLFLAGDNAYRYFQETKGIFLVFLAGKEGEHRALHSPWFDLDEEACGKALETLHRFVVCPLIFQDRQFVPNPLVFR